MRLKPTLVAFCCTAFAMSLLLQPAQALEKSDPAVIPPPATALLAEDFQPFLLERLNYDISFLWFDRLARGELRFRLGKTPGVYEAELDASSLGVASWVTGNRRHHYLTQMELMPDGRMRTLFQQSLIAKGEGKDRREKGKRYVFDYTGKKVRVFRLSGGGEREDASFPMASSEQPNDFLTCIFNFRAGRFGALREGAVFHIPTFTRKGAAEITIRILTPAERKKVKGFPSGGMLAKVILDSEELEKETGSVYVWFDENGRPARGLVENVLGLGNVRGDLRSP